jgi:hypothetical protein
MFVAAVLLDIHDMLDSPTEDNRRNDLPCSLVIGSHFF